MVVVEIHVPLSPAPDLAEGAYPFPWIDAVEDFLAVLEDEGGAEVFDEGVEDEDRYVFFVTGAEERTLLEVASRVATLPGVPTGAFAVVSDEPGEEIGRGRRVELPAAP
ncbi:hypothetical protein [Streptomyces sp. T028]|uniref:hypothetical protein n=1 Tax=Streptomyces sp. T028 TaxID=3394379 RepID=UPI003A8498EB